MSRLKSIQKKTIKTALLLVAFVAGFLGVACLLYPPVYVYRVFAWNDFMNFSQKLLFAGGVFHLGFAIFHLFFWRLFRWKEDLASLTHINRAVMQILNLCLTFLFLVMAYISFFHSRELLTTPLGRTLLISFSLFWFLRLVEQIVFFGIRKRLSILFVLLFLIGMLLYLLPLVWQWT